MKLSTRYIILCLFTLSSAFGRAESVEHDFDAMWRKNPRELVISNSNHTGTTDFCTYTCTGADFYLDKPTSGKLAIYLDADDDFATTTKISNLDSLVILYNYTTASATLYVSVSEDSISWTPVDVNQQIPGVKTIKMSSASDYYVRFIKHDDYKIYIIGVKYYYFDLSDCPNCFLYRP